MIWKEQEKDEDRTRDNKRHKISFHTRRTNLQNKNILHVHSPTSIFFPNTVESFVDAEQFHLWLRNCPWHSSTLNLAPLTTHNMTSGWLRHNLRWRLTKPGMLSQIAPLLTRVKAAWLNWLNDLKRKKGTRKLSRKKTPILDERGKGSSTYVKLINFEQLSRTPRPFSLPSVT